MRTVTEDSLDLYRMTDTCRRFCEMANERFPTNPLSEFERDLWTDLVNAALDDCRETLDDFNECVQRIEAMA